MREIMTHCANLSFVDVVDQIVQRKNDPKIAIFFTTSWMICSKQNEARYGTPRPDPPSLAKFAAAHALVLWKLPLSICKIVLFFVRHSLM